MPLNSKLLKFRNLNIKTYLNNILPQFEKSILISDLNFIDKIRKEVDTEIFKSFLLNSDSLLEVLYTYESVKNNLNYLEDIKNDFKLKNEDKNIYNTNLIKLEEFKTVLNNFTSEVQSYDTGSRILIHFDIFLDENDNKNIFLLTNDILIIGKIDSRTRKYQLVNAYSYLIVDIKIEDGVCGEGIGEEECGGDEGRYREGHGQSDREYGDNEGHGQNEDHNNQRDSFQRDNTSLPSNNSFFYLVLSKSFTKFKGNKKNIYKFYSIFKDLNYNFEDLNEKDKKNKKKNELIEFLIETEQYEEIEKFRKNDNYYRNDYDFNYHLFLTKSDLDKILNLFKNNPLNFLFDFLLKRFKSVLENVNKVMPFKDLIDLLFDEIFMKFRKEQEEILKNCNVNINLNYLLLLEKEILEIFKLIENRNINNDLMKDKLLFDQYDFTYLTDYFTKKKKYYQEEKFKEAKKEIDVLLSEIVK